MQSQVVIYLKLTLQERKGEQKEDLKIYSTQQFQLL